MFSFIYYTIIKSKKASNTSLLYSFSIVSVFFLFIKNKKIKTLLRVLR